MWRYQRHLWLQICSVCKNSNPVLPTFMNYHHILNQGNMTCTVRTSGACAGRTLISNVVFCWPLSCSLSHGHCSVCPWTNYTVSGFLLGIFIPFLWLLKLWVRFPSIELLYSDVVSPLVTQEESNTLTLLT